MTIYKLGKSELIKLTNNVLYTIKTVIITISKTLKTRSISWEICLNNNIRIKTSWRTVVLTLTNHYHSVKDSLPTPLMTQWDEWSGKNMQPFIRLENQPQADDITEMVEHIRLGLMLVEETDIFLSNGNRTTQMAATSSGGASVIRLWKSPYDWSEMRHYQHRWFQCIGNQCISTSTDDSIGCWWLGEVVSQQMMKWTFNWCWGVSFTTL